MLLRSFSSFVWWNIFIPYTLSRLPGNLKDIHPFILERFKNSVRACVPARTIYWVVCSTPHALFFGFGGILGSASRAEFRNHVGFTPSLLYSSTHHSPESFTHLKTGWAQDAWLQWSYENWPLGTYILLFPSRSTLGKVDRDTWNNLALLSWLIKPFWRASFRCKTFFCCIG